MKTIRNLGVLALIVLAGAALSACGGGGGSSSSSGGGGSSQGGGGGSSPPGGGGSSQEAGTDKFLLPYYDASSGHFKLVDMAHPNKKPTTVSGKKVETGYAVVLESYDYNAKTHIYTNDVPAELIYLDNHTLYGVSLAEGDKVKRRQISSATDICRVKNTHKAGRQDTFFVALEGSDSNDTSTQKKWLILSSDSASKPGVALNGRHVVDGVYDTDIKLTGFLVTEAVNGTNKLRLYNKSLSNPQDLLTLDDLQSKVREDAAVNVGGERVVYLTVLTSQGSKTSAYTLYRYSPNTHKMEKIQGSTSTFSSTLTSGVDTKAFYYAADNVLYKVAHGNTKQATLYKAPSGHILTIDALSGKRVVLTETGGLNGLETIAKKDATGSLEVLEQRGTGSLQYRVAAVAGERVFYTRIDASGKTPTYKAKQAMTDSIPKPSKYNAAWVGILHTGTHDALGSAADNDKLVQARFETNTLHLFSYTAKNGQIRNNLGKLPNAGADIYAGFGKNARPPFIFGYSGHSALFSYTGSKSSADAYFINGDKTKSLKRVANRAIVPSF